MEVNNRNYITNPRTIGIRGSRPGAGKDTVGDMICDILRERGLAPRRERFASPPRECNEVLTGVPPDVSETCEGKNMWLPEWGMTVGQMLQRLGTDAVRDHFHTEAWVLSLIRRLEPEELVVISDVRFPNEVEAVRARQGVILHVVRSGPGSPRILAGRDPGHITERGFERGDAASTPDITISNCGSLTDLRESVYLAINRLYPACPVDVSALH